MNSFFKPRSDSTGLKSTQDGTERVLKPKVEVNKALSKGQKQSLILLEEADIIYEEDKQFWTVVIGLIAQSKRPFIITCNDENLIPLQSLSLHGIFRFSSPPVEIAVDRLLMIAACEGHALRRDAVEALYQTRKHDIRACLMDLNYWCQIGVGDRKGGFDWFFPRWPKGIDLDEDSNVVRVVSEGTYLTGMGWLDRDSIPSDGDELWTEEELLQQAWDFWRVDLGDWQDSLDMESWVEHLNVSLISTTRANVLEVYDEFADDMSAADLYGHMGFSTSFAEQIDPTLPEISHKARDDYTVGQQLLEAPIRYDHDTLRTALPSTLRCLTLQHLCSAHERIASGTETPQLERLNEGKVISNIRRKFTETSPSTPAITRHDYSLAFDAIAASDNPTTVLQGSSSGYLDASVFDRTMTMITVDVAPYVRGIVAYDNRLQQQRLKLSNLVSQGGKKNGAKRMRTTRAAYSALEGGSRSTTRPERWFKAELNNHLVMRTGGADWQKAVDETAKECEGVRSSKDTDRESEDELGSN
ncbi:ATPase family AAA domain-containing protein 5 [Pleurostoma richardsiae]|uniref:ATPase family AAA domain-containing protein 5 n=1 Tax=Pleurostoma richardsiae TaxID=41990 RepID=A0AA38RZD1_9PEZI|nr:ATPase family AAA domain-containing protein 5 [Pleurostoma richardsiae]